MTQEQIEALNTWLYLKKCAPGTARSDAWREADKRLKESK